MHNYEIVYQCSIGQIVKCKKCFYDKALSYIKLINENKMLLYEKKIKKNT